MAGTAPYEGLSDSTVLLIGLFRELAETIPFLKNSILTAAIIEKFKSPAQAESTFGVPSPTKSVSISGPNGLTVFAGLKEIISNEVLDPLRAVKNILTGGGGGDDKGTQELTKGAKAAAQATDDLKESLSTVRLDAFFNLFSNATTQLKKFVEAANPGVLQVFDQQLNNVLAAVGQGLLPAFQVLTDSLRELNPILTQIFSTLAPVLATLAGAFGSIFTSVARLVEAFLPIIEPIIEVFSMLVTVVTSLVNVLGAFFSGLLGATQLINKDVMDSFKRFLAEMVKVVSQIAIYLASFAGKGLEVRDALIKSFTPREGAQTIAAAKVGGVSGIESLINATVSQAYAAAPDLGGKEKSDKEYYAEIVDYLKSLNEAKTNDQLVGIIKAGAVAALQAFWESVRNKFNAGSGTSNDTGAKITEVAKRINPLLFGDGANGISEAIGDWVAGLIYGNPNGLQR